MRYSALVLTRDEEVHIADCLRSLATADHVVVIDSGSTDRTLQIARSFAGVRIGSHPFSSFADQRNRGLVDHFVVGEWVLHLDADERVTPELAAELVALEPDADQVAFNIPSRTYLGGRPVPRASGYPIYQTRLTRAGTFRFRQVGHGQKAPTELGPLPRLRNPYEHHPFEKGPMEWERRHLRYADQEAEDLLSGTGVSLAEALKDPIAARQWLKHATGRIPGRAAIVWLYLMFVRGGVLDGSAGWAYCRLRWTYERMVEDAVQKKRAIR